MKKLSLRMGAVSLALALVLALPDISSACCRGLCWRGCGWRGCGWGGCGWGGCGWGGCGWGGCGWGGCGWGVCATPVFYGGTVCAGGPYMSFGAGTVVVRGTNLVPMTSARYVARTNAAAEALPAPANVPASSRIEVQVPTADAEVYFSGHKTKMAGLSRTFETPELEPGRTYFYNVQVKWTDAAGQAQEDSYRLEVSAGKQARVAFGARPGEASSWVAAKTR
jgi:uncharacterized protein (TIGR03000 family)